MDSNSAQHLTSPAHHRHSFSAIVTLSLRTSSILPSSPSVSFPIAVENCYLPHKLLYIETVICGHLSTSPSSGLCYQAIVAIHILSLRFFVPFSPVFETLTFPSFRLFQLYDQENNSFASQLRQASSAIRARIRVLLSAIERLSLAHNAPFLENISQFKFFVFPKPRRWINKGILGFLAPQGEDYTLHIDAVLQR